eukprot:1157619-Pelagomonas_calceolata.AAC.11
MSNIQADSPCSRVLMATAYSAMKQNAGHAITCRCPWAACACGYHPQALCCAVISSSQGWWACQVSSSIVCVYCVRFVCVPRVLAPPKSRAAPGLIEECATSCLFYTFKGAADGQRPGPCVCSARQAYMQQWFLEALLT